jgi:serine/threonine-protein kinase HipA
MSALNVELYGTLLGILTQKRNFLEFNTDIDVFTKYQLSSTIMSLAVPLLLQYTVAQKKRSGNFFAELLPEGRNYYWLVQTIPHSERTAFGMLRKYGKDIAGALTIFDPEDPASSAKPESELVDGKKIRYLLEHMPQAALANSPISGRTSLGGVQGKIVLARKDSSWHRVHNGYPSTHILKPVVPEYPTMIYDEAFCMELAYKSDLTKYPTWIESFDGADALVIERYDRSNDVKVGRIHQEDFNQALGAGGSDKYQEYSGKVSAKRIAQTLARFGKDEDVIKFASQLVFAVAIGNLDMHAKNVSILHLPDETIKLAPIYDQVPLRHQNTDGKMALAVNGVYSHANISLRDIVSELASWQCRCFSDDAGIVFFVRNCLETYNDALSDTALNDKAHQSLKAEISLFISNLLLGKSVGRITDG